MSEDDLATRNSNGPAAINLLLLPRISGSGSPSSPGASPAGRGADAVWIPYGVTHRGRAIVTAMLVRYRKLTSTFDTTAYKSEVGAASREARDRHRALGGRDGEGALEAGAIGAAGAVIGGLASTPRQVEAEEYEASLDEVRAMVRSGALTAQDLVDLDSGWKSIGDCYELDDLVHEPNPLTAKTITIGILIVLAVLALLTLMS